MGRERKSLLGLLFVLLVALFISGSVYGQSTFQDVPDIRNIRNLFLNKQYDQLINIFNGYQKKCEADVKYEFAMDDLFSIFDEDNPAYEENLNNWVKTYKNSWVPLIARASYLERLGFKARGQGWAKDTTEKQFKEMRWYFYKAMQDIEAAFQLNPNIIHAYSLKMTINAANSNKKNNKELIETVLNRYPGSYLMRTYYLIGITPRWGGSYAKMDSFAKESLRYSKLNPLINTLPGYVYWDQADMALINGNLPLAIRLSKQALEYGENYSFRYQLAKLYFQNVERDKALFEVERAIALRPNKQDAQQMRCNFILAKDPLAHCSY